MLSRAKPVLGLTRSKPTADSAFAQAQKLRDRTAELFRVAFPELNQGEVRLVSGLIVGRPGAGKTTAGNRLAWQGQRRWGAKNVNIVADDSLEEAMARFNGLPFQFLFVDDPITKQSSRDSMTNKETQGRYYRIRHIFSDMAGSKTGCLSVLWAPQRLMALDVYARDSDYIIFKTWPSPAQEDAQKQIMKMLSPEAVKELQRITKAALVRRDNDAKSLGVVYFTADGSEGTVRLEPAPDFVLRFPEKEKADAVDVGDFSLSAAEAVKAISKEKGWKARTDIYIDVQLKGITQVEAAAKYGVTQGRISQAIRSVRGEMYRRYGEAFELWKAKELKARFPHCDVVRNGAIGQPDIVVRDPRTEQHTVYSCKCLDFKQRHHLPRSELEPELRFARKKGCSAVLAVYNIADGRQYPELIIDHESSDDSISIDVISSGM